MQSNSVNTNTDEAIERVLINDVSCYSSKTVKKKPNFRKKNQMKEDISTDKLNISNLHKTIIPRIKHTETLKNRSSIYL